jgi:hypothetical protein
MAREMWCQTCALEEPVVHERATLVVDGEPMCNAHARIAERGKLVLSRFATAAPVELPAPAVLATPDVRLCSRGCGGPPHRGRCSTGISQAVAHHEQATEPESPEPTRKRGKMDVLVSKTIRLDEIPPESQPTPKVQGRLGALWIKIQALKPGECERVVNRNRGHATQTLMHMRKKAKSAGRVLKDSRDGTLLYLWLEPKE